MSHQQQAEVSAKQPSAREYIERLRAFSIEQFAHLFSVGRTSVFEEIKSGRLKTYTVGRRRYISVAAADAWQRDREAEAQAVTSLDE